MHLIFGDLHLCHARPSARRGKNPNPHAPVARGFIPGKTPSTHPRKPTSAANSPTERTGNHDQPSPGPKPIPTSRVQFLVAPTKRRDPAFALIGPSGNAPAGRGFIPGKTPSTHPRKSTRAAQSTDTQTNTGTGQKKRHSARSRDDLDLPFRTFSRYNNKHASGT